eukprot:TRINITY_DN1348_c0_g2_i1.p1 TRINITY_DN1348_c0_g2~~TRINITY_DN1348_c0_g2_i1.p1  ORF type:complete len:543 (-),score=160.39 TRINITY_DN1348_c0_g2_i1:36-1664(-)
MFGAFEILAVVVAVALSSAAPPLATVNFTIGMWCGVPQEFLNASRLAEVRDAGLTYASAPCAGVDDAAAYNALLLSYAAAAGVRALVTDPRAEAAGAGQDVAANVRAVVADYAAEEALLGYFLGDEPSAQAFAGLAAATSAFAESDPLHPAYVNLLPDYASTGAFGVDSYSQYVSDFMEEVRPVFTSYDYYPFLSDGTDMPSFFANLEVFREQALNANVQWWVYLQSISYNGHRVATEAEKRWQAMHIAVYGATGACYFTYWTPTQTSENFGDGIIAPDGTRTSQFPEVQRINQKLSAIGKYTAAATSLDVFHNGALAVDTHPRVPYAPVYLPSPAAVTVGTFAAADGGVLAMLVNRDYINTVTTDAVLASGDGQPQQLDTNADAFKPIQHTANDSCGVRVQITLQPGDATLLYLSGPVPQGAPGAEAFAGIVRSDAGWLDVVDSAFGTQRLRSAGWKECPQGYTLDGLDFESDGFWLCVRDDLYDKRVFYFGNVVQDKGFFYQVTSGTTLYEGMAGWATCPEGSVLLGERVESNGYWVCLL